MQKISHFFSGFINILIFTGLHIFTVNAQQNQNNFWFFGHNAGLDFSGGQPINIDSPLDTYEGCASISDSEGNLLFFTDGIFVFDNNKTIMPNGSGLLGDPSATSSAIIVPKPCSLFEYFIFTIDFINGNDGLNYSLVDMSLNGGLGDVVATQKNVPLNGPNSEKVCALKKSNNLDFWVISCEKDNNVFYVYEVTFDGINLVNTYIIGATITAYGYMKASPCGDKIAVANLQGNGDTGVDIIIYDFDNATGEITNAVEIDEGIDRCYGIEFSPNCQFLYFSEIGFTNQSVDGKIYQVDIFNPNFPIVEIGIIPDANEINENRYACGALQLSPEANQRILVAKDGEYQLAAIENPNQAFPGCFLVQDAVFLDQPCLLGLPTFISGTISDMCGTCNPEESEDECGICDDDPTNDNETCIDCAGIPNGTTEIDECGICGGPGIPEEACDCEGNVIDECGICGGPGIPEGACDCEGNELDECGICGGIGIPDGACDCEGNTSIADGECDCEGNVMDECGVCGGAGIPEDACNCEGNVLDECGICGGTGIAEGECDCEGNQLSVLITNGFSPNNDGINDFITIYANKEVEFKTFKIFNRWGQKVFELNNFNVFEKYRLWNGDGVELNVGVYVFFGRYSCESNDDLIIKGNITLLK